MKNYTVNTAFITAGTTTICTWMTAWPCTCIAGKRKTNKFPGLGTSVYVNGDWSGQQLWYEIVHTLKSGQDERKKKDAEPVFSEIDCQHILKWHKVVRKVETSDWAFSKLPFIKYKVNLSLCPKYEYIIQVVSKLWLPGVKVSNDHKRNFKNLEMLTAWARNKGFAPTHLAKCDPSLKYMFCLEFMRNLSRCIWYLILKLTAADLS
jgi:hypothetical protein